MLDGRTRAGVHLRVRCLRDDTRGQQMTEEARAVPRLDEFQPPVQCLHERPALVIGDRERRLDPQDAVGEVRGRQPDALVAQQIAAEEPGETLLAGQRAEESLVREDVRIGRQLHAHQQPLAPDVGHQARVRGTDLLKALAEQVGAVGHLTHQGLAVLGDQFERPESDPGAERVAAEGRRVPQAEVLAERGLAEEHGADGHHATAERLGQRHDVRDDPAVLAPEQPSRTAESGLHLVDHQARPVPGAQLPRGQQELLGREVDAALALDRLHHERGDVRAVLVEQLGQRADVVERDVPEAGHGCAERLLVARASGRGQRAECLAVEGVAGGDDAVASGGGTGDLDGRLDRLRAAVAEPRLGETGRGGLDQPLGEQCRRALHGGLRQARFGRLAQVGDGLPDAGRVVPEGQGSVGAGEVEIRVAVGVVEGRAQAAHVGDVEAEPVEGPGDVRVDVPPVAVGRGVAGRESFETAAQLGPPVVPVAGGGVLVAGGGVLVRGPGVVLRVHHVLVHGVVTILRGSQECSAVRPLRPRTARLCVPGRRVPRRWT